MCSVSVSSSTPRTHLLREKSTSSLCAMLRAQWRCWLCMQIVDTLCGYQHCWSLQHAVFAAVLPDSESLLLRIQSNIWNVLCGPFFADCSLQDGSGFFYSKFPPPAGLQGVEGKSAGTELDVVGGNRVFYHKLGTSAAADDQLVYEAGAENAKWLLSCQSTDDYETLLVCVLAGIYLYAIVSAVCLDVDISCHVNVCHHEVVVPLSCKCVEVGVRIGVYAWLVAILVIVQHCKCID
jgi:Prolyl oligopeptidase, N-terminal beta-propeller domain